MSAAFMWNEVVCTAQWHGKDWMSKSKLSWVANSMREVMVLRWWWCMVANLHLPRSDVTGVEKCGHIGMTIPHGQLTAYKKHQHNQSQFKIMALLFCDKSKAESGFKQHKSSYSCVISLFLELSVSQTFWKSILICLFCPIQTKVVAKCQYICSPSLL